MLQAQILELARRVATSDPNNALEQRSLFEALVAIRKQVDRETFPRACDYLNGAGLLMTFMQHLGHVGGSHVQDVVAMVLEAAHRYMSVPVQPSAAPPEKAASSTLGTMHVISDMLLGQILVRKGYVTEGQVKEAIELQAKTGSRFGEALMTLGVIEWGQLEEGLKYQDACRNLVEGVAETQRSHTAGPPAPKKLELDPDYDRGLKLMSDVMLGEVLVRNSLITQEQLEAGLAAQRGSGMRIGEALVNMGACTWKDVRHAIQLQGQMRRYAS